MTAVVGCGACTSRGHAGTSTRVMNSRPFIRSPRRAGSVSGTVRPSALAVLRLTTVSYLVRACTGEYAVDITCAALVDDVGAKRDQGSLGDEEAALIDLQGADAGPPA